VGADLVGKVVHGKSYPLLTRNRLLTMEVLIT
jgi:hypothetical protein